MESFNIQDLPDSWYDIIQHEGNEFIQRIGHYPIELGLMIIQVIMQAVVYNILNREDRQAFLVKMLDAFLEQFEDWEKEDGQEGSED